MGHPTIRQIWGARERRFRKSRSHLSTWQTSSLSLPIPLDFGLMNLEAPVDCPAQAEQREVATVIFWTRFNGCLWWTQEAS